MDLCKISEIKKLMNKYNFKPEKFFGQNFIIESTVCPRMSEMCSDNPEMGVIEIGPGAGVLTKELGKRYKKVVAIEIDKSLIPVLDYTLSGLDNVKIINEDVLKIDLKKLIIDEFDDMEVCVCANLPYYITSPIIMKLLEEEIPLKYITVMIQKEAAERICAIPGQRACGAISIAIRYYSEPKILFDVPRNSFYPAPEVDSSVIRLEISDLRKKMIKNKDLFFRIVKCGFSQRRKTLINTLSKGVNLSKSVIESLFLDMDIPLSARAEELSFEQFAILSERLSEIVKN